MNRSRRNYFGTLLRRRRIEKGYSLRKFASAIGVSPTYLSIVETGKSYYAPSAERVRIMAELLGEDADEWLALAGRAPEAAVKIVQKDPERMLALLRAAERLTPEQRKELLAKTERRGCAAGKEKT